ncbi:kinase-like domain-containing protein [Peziza echinospora]|nr:kinase-like domain-containing protein [Peziza echinospora]
MATSEFVENEDYSDQPSIPMRTDVMPTTTGHTVPSEIPPQPPFKILNPVSFMLNSDSSPIIDGSPRLRGRCHDEFVKSIRAQIIKAGMPEVIPSIRRNGKSLKHTKKTEIRCRFYPRETVQAILTEDVVKKILHHNCPEFCDIVRRTEIDNSPFGLKYTRNKSPEQVREWTKHIVHGPGVAQKGPTIMLFALLVMIRRPLFIVGFLEHMVDDEAFEKICPHLDQDPESIFKYWQKFHDRFPEIDHDQFSFDDGQYPNKETSGMNATEEAQLAEIEGGNHEEELDSDHDQEEVTKRGNPSTRAADMFCSLMWSFVTPEIPSTSGLFKYMLNPKVILPILKFKEIGEGGFTKIFRVRIHPAYCRLIPEEYRAKNNWYAVKQMEIKSHGYKMADLDKELANLRAVQTHADGPHPNVIRFLAAYVHESMSDRDLEACHLLMPLYDGDLSSFLDAKVRATRPYSMVRNGVYKGLLGVVGAVQYLVETIKMHRLDLKPANILVRRGQDGEVITMVVTDFGRSKIVSSDMTRTTQAIKFDGNISANFAPPEAEAKQDSNGGLLVQQIAPELRAKYDVWPLGCVFTEVLTYLVMGPAGIARFKNHLTLESAKENTEDLPLRYWQLGQGGNPVVRQSVTNWLHTELSDFNNYASHDESIQNRCIDFIRWNVEITSSMLKPDAGKRTSLTDLISKIRSMLINQSGIMKEVIPDEQAFYKLLGGRKKETPNSLMVPGTVSSSSAPQAPKLHRFSDSTTYQRVDVDSIDEEPTGNQKQASTKAPPPRVDDTANSKDFPPIPPVSHTTASPPLEKELKGVCLVKRANEEYLLSIDVAGFLINGISGIGQVLVCSVPKSHGPGYDLAIHLLDNASNSNPKAIEHRVLRRDTMVVPLHIVRRQAMNALTILNQPEYYAIQFGETESNSSNHMIQTSNKKDMKFLLYNLTQQYVAIAYV